MIPRPALPRLLAAAALAAAAVAVRGVWIPFHRHRFDGHELDYLRAFQGAPLAESTRLYPTLAWLYRQLGRLSDDPNLLLWIALTVGVATVAAAGLAAGRRFGEPAGWIAAALLVASPAHAFWSTSAYNVALPQLLLVSALAARGWTGALLYAAACLFRVELMALAPAVALMVGPGREGLKTAAGAAGGLVMLPLLETAPPLHGPLDVLPINLLLPDFLGPLGAPLGLVLVALCADRRSWTWLAAAGWVHLVGACFDDYGWRHGLTGGVALAGVVASAWSLGALRRVAAAAALGLSLWGCSQVARWYYAPQATFEARVVGGLEALEALEAPPTCTEIQDDPLAPESHWNDWPAGPVCWREEAIHYQWNSRGLMARRLRMRRAYDLEPIGVLRAPSGPRIYYAVQR